MSGTEGAMRQLGWLVETPALCESKWFPSWLYAWKWLRDTGRYREKGITVYPCFKEEQ